MAYKKILLDNTICKRRFHLTYDDAAPKVPKVEIHCLHCDKIIFKESDHPQVTLARDENLIKANQFGLVQVEGCDFPIYKK